MDAEREDHYNKNLLECSEPSRQIGSDLNKSHWFATGSV